MSDVRPAARVLANIEVALVSDGFDAAVAVAERSVATLPRVATIAVGATLELRDALAVEWGCSPSEVMRRLADRAPHRP